MDLTPDQFTILRWLNELPDEGLTQRDLSELMASDANTIAGLLKRMEDGGLISRKPHESDRRANIVELSDEGRRVYAEAAKEAKALQEAVLEKLPPRRRARFLKDLNRVALACRSALLEN